MRIGQLAAASGLTTKTLRFYERAGLLPDPPRRHLRPDRLHRRHNLQHPHGHGALIMASHRSAQPLPPEVARHARWTRPGLDR